MDLNWSLLQCHRGCIKGRVQHATCPLGPQCNSELPHSRPSFRCFEEFGNECLEKGTWNKKFLLQVLFLSRICALSLSIRYNLPFVNCFNKSSPTPPSSSWPMGHWWGVGTLLLSILGPAECRGDRVECHALSTCCSHAHCVLCKSMFVCVHYQPVVVQYLSVDTASMLL